MERVASFLLMVLVAGTATRGQTEAKSPKEDLGTISGVVMKMAGSVPLRKARAWLQSTDDPRRSISALTDAAGKFTLKDIEPGSYRLSISRAGFVTEQYGRRKPGGPGAILTLRAKQEMKLEFRLIPSGVISGKILDEDGEPLPIVSVLALKQIYADGKRTLGTMARAETNDLGEYRLHGLPPGRYFVSANYLSWNRFGDQGEMISADEQAHPEGYAKMYYPGTADAWKAEAITVKPGEEVSSIEMLMRPVTVHRVRGHVYNQITHRPATGATVLLIPQKESRQWESMLQAELRKSDGSFELSEVTPAEYVLAVYWFDEGKSYVSRQTLVVGNADVEGIAMTISPGATINGRMVWDGRPSLEQDELTIMAQPVDIPFAFEGQMRVNRDNTFVLREVGEGTYRAIVNGQSKDCYIKDVRYGEASGLKDGFTVAKGEGSNLEITVSSHGARVEGTVMDANGLPLPGVAVALVPEALRRDQFRLYKSQNTDQYGHFDLRGITPGEYKVFSWEEAEQDAWQDAEFLKPFESKGERVILNDDDKKDVKITVISAIKGEEVKP